MRTSVAALRRALSWRPSSITIPDGADRLHEIKYDGYRLQARIDGDDVQLLTRNGLDWTHRFSALSHALRALKLRSALMDGEAVVEDASGHSSFSQLVEALKEGGRSDEVVFYAFDLLHFDGVAVREAPLVDRKRLLETVLGPRRKNRGCATARISMTRRIRSSPTLVRSDSRA